MRYALISDIHPNLDVADGAVGVEFVRVEYDLQKAMRGISGGGLPPEFATHLETGGR